MPMRRRPRGLGGALRAREHHCIVPPPSTGLRWSVGRGDAIAIVATQRLALGSSDAPLHVSFWHLGRVWLGRSVLRLLLQGKLLQASCVLASRRSIGVEGFLLCGVGAYVGGAAWSEGAAGDGLRLRLRGMLGFGLRMPLEPARHACRRTVQCLY